MKRFGLTVALLLGLLLLGIVIVYYGVPRFIQPQLIRAQVLEPLEKLTAGSLTYSGFELSYFPRFKVTFLDVRLKGSGNRSLQARAEQVEIEPDSFPLLIRQFRVRHLKIDGADIDILGGPEDLWTSVRLRAVTAEALPLGTLKAMRIRMEGEFADSGGTFGGDFRVGVKSFSEWQWMDTVIHGFFKADSGDLSRWYDHLGIKNKVTVQAGTGRARVSIKKDKGLSWMDVSGDMQCSQLAYSWSKEDQKINALAMDLSLDFESTVDPVKSEWALRRSAFQFPPGKVEVSGQGNYRSGEIQDLRFSAPKIQLEQVPHYFVMAQEALPFNIGFSGLGQIELSFKGTRQKMNIYLNSDLAPAVLTYGKFLDKPKEVPFSVILEAVVQNGDLLNGNLSVRFNEALAKGTVKNLNLSTGEGQINLITNKHLVSSWGPLVPFLRELDLSGGMKILANWEGDLHDLGAAKKVFNLTLEEGRIKHKSGTPITDIRIELDYDSAMGLVIKQLDAVVGKTPVTGQISIYNPAQEAVVKVILSSPEADASETLLILESLFPESSVVQSKIKNLRQWLATIPASILSGKNFVLEAELKDGVWQVEKLGLDIGAGRVMTQGTILARENLAKIESHLEISKTDLAAFFAPVDGQELCSGELFLNGDFRGDHLSPEGLTQAITGSGSLLINKASFSTFDLFEVLGRIPSFEPLKAAAAGRTSFDDIRGHFRSEGGKFTTEDFVFLSSDFSIDAKGEVSYTGQLNFRLELYLSQAQARKVLGEAAGQMGMNEGEWFGPVPLIMTGTLAKPEIRADSEGANSLLNRVERGDVQGTLRNFLREDALFEDFSKN